MVYIIFLIFYGVYHCFTKCLLFSRIHIVFIVVFVYFRFHTIEDLAVYFSLNSNAYFAIPASYTAIDYRKYLSKLVLRSLKVSIILSSPKCSFSSKFDLISYSPIILFSVRRSTGEIIGYLMFCPRAIEKLI